MAYTISNTINTYYEEHGNGEPVLFIHGLGSSSHDWRYQLDFFADYYKVITYDIRGHGLTDSSNSQISISLLAEDCSELIKSLNISPPHIIGISLGGMIAFQLAVSYPQLVKSLTVVNSIPEFNIDKLSLRFKFWTRIAIVKLFGLKTFGRLLGKKLFPGDEFIELRNEFVIKWSKNDKRAYLNTLKSMIGWSVKEQLNLIKCPTLIIASEFDYTSIDLKKFYASKIARVELKMIENTRHALPVEDHYKFNTVLHEFLNRNK